MIDFQHLYLKKTTDLAFKIFSAALVYDHCFVLSFYCRLLLEKSTYSHGEMLVYERGSRTYKIASHRKAV